MDHSNDDPDDEHEETEDAQAHAEDGHDDADATHEDAEPERTTIRTGRDFEQQYRLDAAEAGRFLVDLGEQLQNGDELTVTDDEWELPFAFGEPVGLELDFEGVGEPELEIELELPGRTDEKAPNVD
jgi:amphi-Trp domain-containing protein